MSTTESKTVEEAIPAAAPAPATETKPEPVAADPASEPVQPIGEAISTPEAGVEEPKAAPVAAPISAPAPVEETKEAAPEKNAESTGTSTPISLSPLSKLFAELPAVVREAEYTEMWGVELKDESDVPTSIVLEKFLRANTKDVTKAKAQLKEALVWRKKMQPIKLLSETEFDKSKFGDLGFVTTYKTEEGKEIITWNIYGAVKDKKATFGNVEEFIKWRAALMELSVRELDLPSATTKIPEDGVDTYRMIQVHDYQNVSFLRMDPAVKAASKETIQVFSMAYPELLKEKFFVNVPVLMGWVFAAMKLFLAPETVKKFHPLSYGSSLAGELKSFGEQLPKTYGGKGKEIKDGLTVKYATPAPAPEAVEAVTKETPATTPAAVPAETAPVVTSETPAATTEAPEAK